MSKHGLSPPKRSKQGRTSNFRGNPFTGCWIWTGWTDKNGYGTTSWEGQKVRVHVAAFESFYGTIPQGMNVCHSCDRPSCYRPDHLFLGTQKQNIDDMTSKGRWAGNTRLSDEQRQAIIECNNKRGRETVELKQLSEKFNISYSHARTIKE